MNYLKFPHDELLAIVNKAIDTIDGKTQFDRWTFTATNNLKSPADWIESQFRGNSGSASALQKLGHYVPIRVALIQIIILLAIGKEEEADRIKQIILDRTGLTRDELKGFLNQIISKNEGFIRSGYEGYRKLRDN